MVVLDALHSIQAHLEPDLAVRWNCKAGKCGSCSAEVNGKPRLTCKTRMDALPTDKPIIVYPMKSFPVIKDLVTDVSWNYRVNKKIPPFSPKPKTDWKMYQEDMDRVQEFRKCIECFLCQNVCHVVRDHHKKEEFGGPRFFVRVAALEIDPKSTRLNSSHQIISYAAFSFKKKKQTPSPGHHDPACFTKQAPVTSPNT